MSTKFDGIQGTKVWCKFGMNLKWHIGLWYEFKNSWRFEGGCGLRRVEQHYVPKPEIAVFKCVPQLDGNTCGLCLNKEEK
jgi:hypothetical protein